MVSHGETGTPDRTAIDAFFSSTYLDFPILLSPRVEFLSKYTLACTGDLSVNQPSMIPVRHFIRAMGASPPLAGVDPDEYPSLFNWLPPDTIKDVFSQAHYTAVDLYQSAINGLNDKVCGRLAKELVTVKDPTSSEYLAYQRWYYWNLLISLPDMKWMNGGRKKPLKIRLGSHTYVTDGRVIVGLGDKTNPLYNRVMTWEQVLMVKDALYSRAQVRSAARVFYPSSTTLTTAISHLERWHEECLTRHSNEGYEILKCSEDLAKAYLSLRSGSDVFQAEGPYGRMVKKITKKEEDLGTRHSYLSGKFEHIMGTCGSIAECVEIFGLQKISGHPLVDPYRGGKSACEVARAPDQTRLTDALRVDAMFKRKFTEAFIRKNSCWPDVTFVDKNKGKKLQEYRSMNYLGGHRMVCPLSDWNNLKFERIFEFDYAPNFLELMDDRSISQYRTNIQSNWDKDVEPRSHRRLLIEMINKEEINIKEIVRMVMRREVPYDWLIVALHPKEREFKLAPRMFSMMVFEMRVFFAATEMNLADSVFPYMSSLTMTMSRNQVMKRFLNMTSTNGNDTLKTLFLEVDLSRWNLRWRKLIIHMIGETLDDMFGTPGVYTYVHSFFEQCLIVVRTAGLRPGGIEYDPPPEGELVWYNHKGGFEGIVQKHWSIPTTIALDIALDDTAYHYQLTGQGDNQVIVVQYTRDPALAAIDQAKAIRDDILSRVKESYERIGQSVKPEECLESSSTVTYSKDVYVDGLYYPTTLKFHSRLFPHSSQDFPSVRGNVGAIASGTIAGAERSDVPIRGLYLYYLHAGMYLTQVARGDAAYGDHLKASFRGTEDQDDWIRFVLTLPSDLGGFPTLGPADFLYKGGSDPLSKSLASLILMGTKHSRLCNRMLAQLSEDKWFAKEPKTLSLIRDPYSIPLDKPVTPIDGITKKTMDAIKDEFKNTSLRELVASDVDEHMDGVVRALSSLKPFNPLIAHDILDCSLYGIVDAVGKMFVATRTLQGVARSYDASIVARLFDLERRGLLYLVERFRQLPGSPWKIRSIYHTATALRDRWGPTCPIPEGITSYHPLDFPLTLGRNSYLKEGIHACVIGGKEAAAGRGPYDPYLGSKTLEKRSEHGYKIIGSDTSSMAFRKLQLISSQTGSDQRLKALIDLVGLTRSNTVLSRISDRLPSVKGGTLSHRYAARVGYQDAHCIGSPNFYTHCVVSADKAGRLTGGVDDYAVMIQEFYLAGLSVLALTRSEVSSMVWCTDEVHMDPLPNLDLAITASVDIPVPRLTSNPLAYVEVIRLRQVRGIKRHRSFRPRDWLAGTRFERGEKVRILEAFMRESSWATGLVDQALDSSVQHTVAQELDLSEVIGAGVSALLEAASNVVADIAIAKETRTRVQRRDRWRIEAITTKASFPFAATFSRHMAHPLLRTDPCTRAFNLYTAPRYIRGQNPLPRLAALISEMAATKALGLPTAYASRTLSSTLSERPNGTLELVSGMFTRILLYWQHRDELSELLLKQIYSRFVLRIFRSTGTEEQKVSTMIASMTTVARWATASNRLLLADELERALNGRIVHYSSSARELCRLLRRASQPTKAERVLKTASPLHLRPLTLKISALGRPPVVPETDLMKSIEETVLAHRGLGSHWKDGRLWGGYQRLWSQHPVLVVGVGPGVIAATAISSGTPFVYGLDLPVNTPLAPNQYINYVPREVLRINGSGKYLHLPESYTTSGNWMCPNVAQSVLRSVPQDTTVVIDIEGGRRGALHELFSPVFEAKWKGSTVCKVVASQHEIEDLCSFLYSSRVRPSFYSAGVPSGGSYPVLVHIPSFSNFEHPGKCLTRHYLATFFSTNPSRLSRVPHRDTEALAWACLNVLYPSTLDSPVEIYPRLLSLYSRLKGDYESRPSYEWWTSLLLAIALFWWVNNGGESMMVLRWERAGAAVIATSAGDVTQGWSRTKSRVVTTLGARLLIR